MKLNPILNQEPFPVVKVERYALLLDVPKGGNECTYVIENSAFRPVIMSTNCPIQRSVCSHTIVVRRDASLVRGGRCLEL